MPWRGFVSLVGTSLVVTGLSGFALVMTLPALPTDVVQPVAAMITGEVPRMPDVATSPVASPFDVTDRPITRLQIPSIDLDTGVVPAPLVLHDGTSTWDVPKFLAGHAEGTAGAGEAGNAVLVGHVTSLTLGNVFEHLSGVRPGAVIYVFSGQRALDYRVVDARSVGRADVSVLDWTTTPTLSLITCTGLWLPTMWDYTERLVVRAELSS